MLSLLLPLLSAAPLALAAPPAAQFPAADRAELRVRAEITTGFGIPSSGHLSPIFNQPILDVAQDYASGCLQSDRLHRSNRPDLTQIWAPNSRLIPARTLSQPPSRPRNRPAPPPPRRFRLALGGGGGVSTPAGEWFDGIDGGSAWELNARYAINANLWLGLSYRHQDLEPTTKFSDRPGDLTFYLHEGYFLLGLSRSVGGDRAPIAYLQFGLGAVDHNLSDNSVNPEFGFHEDRLGVLAGIGAIVPLSSSLGIDVEAQVRGTGQGASNPYDPNSGTTGVLLGLSARVVWMVGR